MASLGEAGRGDGIPQYGRGVQPQQGNVIIPVWIVIIRVDELGPNLDGLLVPLSPIILADHCLIHGYLNYRINLNLANSRHESFDLFS